MTATALGRRSLLAKLGAGTLSLGAQIRATLAMLRAAVGALGRMEWSEAIGQAYLLANRSIFFVVVILGFTGAIMVLQASAQALKILGDLSQIGPGFLQLVIREFGPTITAFMIAARYGAGVAAELGAMKITEQVDALRMTGADVASYLVAPRIVGGIIGMPLVVVLGTTVAYIAGGLTAHYGFDVPYDIYFKMSLVREGDVVVGMAKAVAFGVAVPLVACQSGLAARGGAPGVGRATTGAVIGGSTAVLFLDLVIGVAGYLVGL